jgi:proteasome accessory factor B
LSLRGDLAPLATRVFPESKVEPGPGGSTAIVVATYLDGLLRYALSLGADCWVTAPPEAVSRWKAMAARVRSAHAGASRAGLESIQ